MSLSIYERTEKYVDDDGATVVEFRYCEDDTLAKLREVWITPEEARQLSKLLLKFADRADKERSRHA